MVVLFRQSQDNIEEYKICSKLFKTVKLRTECPDGLVIGRYSVLPYYSEVEQDLLNKGAYLINNKQQHNYIALMEWVKDLKDLTPKTYNRFTWPSAPSGPYIVKGETNSKKSQWNTMMYAPDKLEANRIATKLACDGLIGEQQIVYREYIPLKTLEVGINGLPFSNEWRFFFYKEKELCRGFYWSCSEKMGKINKRGIETAHHCAKIIAKYTNFFVVDVAETEKGDWICIEVNDAQMSGLSECNAYELYFNLKNALV